MHNEAIESFVDAVKQLTAERDKLESEYDCLLHERDRLLTTIKLAGQDISTLTAERDELRAELAALKAKHEPPLFEAGKCYHTRKGRIVEVHTTNDATYPLCHCVPGTWDGRAHGDSYHAVSADGKSCIGVFSDDLLPGAVDPPPPPTWKAPASLPDGEYVWTGISFHRRDHIELRLAGKDTISPIYRDWANPPREGIWLVKDGIGTWQGESK